MATFSLSNNMINISGAKDFNIANVGNLTGSASFGLSQTDEGTNSTVFDVKQMNSSGSAALRMAGGNSNNTRFTGYNMFASFDSDSESFYNVEFDTVNSVFDFTGTTSGAMIATTQNSYNNEIRLGGGKTAIDGENISADKGVSGQTEARYYNNTVVDAGRSNSFISSENSATKFTTTMTSRGAFIAGGDIQDTYYLNGANATVVGGSGYNIFNNTGTSIYNAVFGGYGTNVYNDFGTRNMYQGSYALNDYGYNGADTIRFYGNYGIARVNAQNAADDPSIYYNGGSYNAGFAGDMGELPDGTTVSYNDIMNGAYANYRYKDGLNWTMKDFYSSSAASEGYAKYYSSMAMMNVLEWDDSVLWLP